MTAYDELDQTGECGPQTVALLRQLAAQVTRTSSFPAPTGHQGWGGEAIDDLLADIFESKGPAFVLSCLAQATDQPSLERLLLAVVRNFLIDQAKRTERGKLRRRLSRILTADPRFVPTATRSGVTSWALASHPEGHRWQGDLADLQDVASRVRGVSITRWNTSGPTPRATVQAITTVVAGVLTWAGGAVREEDLARILQYRFALITPPAFVPLRADDRWAEPWAPADNGPADAGAAEVRAEEIWSALTATERELLPYLGQSKSELATITGTGPRQAQAIADRLIEELRLAVRDDEDADAVLIVLRQKCLVRA